MSSISGFVLLVAIGAFASLETVASPGDYDEVIEEGTQAIEDGDFERALELSRPFADAGNADAQFTLGMIFGWGYGHAVDDPTTEQREEKAFIWYRRAAINGHEEAARLLSDAYRNGWYGQKKDPALSKCWKSVIDLNVVPSECVSLLKMREIDRSCRQER